jgi:predicted TIM-barrel fold metal-dependent hydrolase
VIVDALMLLGENRFGQTLEVPDALAVCRQLGIDKLVAAPARPLDYHLEPANERLAAAARESGGRLAALGRIDPLNGWRAVAEARRCFDDLGCVGLFLHPGEESFPVTAARRVLELAAERRRPVVVATGWFALSEPLQVAQAAADFPDLPVVMTHGGQINISGLSMADAWLALNASDSLFVMTNGEYRQDFIERLASELGPERVLYASYAPAFDPVFEHKRIRSARMTGDARAAVEGGNAARLFQLA